MKIEHLPNVLSGEFFLDHRPNGGTVILLRSLLVTCEIYALAIVVKSCTNSGAMFAYSGAQLAADVNATIPWFAAIFAGVYAALYARYSSQWSYLASLYNQLMATSISTPDPSPTQKEDLASWQAAFIEDAADLHLATKPMFATVISAMLAEPQIRDAFTSSTISGLERLAALEGSIQRALHVSA